MSQDGLSRPGLPRRGTSRVRWHFGLLAVAALATVAVAFVPAVLIRPFSAQTPAMVAVAYALKSVSPLVAPVGATLTAMLAVLLLHERPRPLAVAATILAVAPALLAGWFSHQNHFEWMFAPLADGRFTRAAEVDFVAGTDMVVAIDVAGDAVAYPVRQMAFHHLFNDEVGKLPVVSTY